MEGTELKHLAYSSPQQSYCSRIGLIHFVCRFVYGWNVVESLVVVPRIWKMRSQKWCTTIRDDIIR